MNNKMYVIDACALIDASKNYPLDMETFQSIWEKIAELFDKGMLISSSEIYDELKDKDLQKWISKYKNCFVSLDKNIQEQTKQVLKQFPNMINLNKNKKSSSNGDPFLVATAIVNKGIIITNEGKGGNQIPAVSNYFNIETINLNQFIREIMK